MEKDIMKVVMSQKEIEGICERLGHDISVDYEGKCPLFIGLLKGCQPFMCDLLKHVKGYAEITYMSVSSYSGTSSTGNIKIKQDVTVPVDGRDVIIVDDIVDTGRTVQEIVKLFKSRNAKSIQVCCLLNKPEGRQVEVDVKYIGGRVPKEFVVGYGLDYDELYRNLPYIGVLKPEIYSK